MNTILEMHFAMKDHGVWYTEETHYSVEIDIVSSNGHKICIMENREPADYIVFTYNHIINICHDYISMAKKIQELEEQVEKLSK